MSEAPERIWIEDEFGDGDEDQWTYGTWDVRNYRGYVVEYVRADLALPAVQPDAREAALREAADVGWASGLEIRDDAPDYLSEWQRGFVSGCTAFRNAILALKGESHE